MTVVSAGDESVSKTSAPKPPRTLMLPQNWFVFDRARMRHRQRGWRITNSRWCCTNTSPKSILVTSLKLCIGHNERGSAHEISRTR